MAKLKFSKADPDKVKNIMHVFSKARDEAFIKKHEHYRIKFYISFVLNVTLIIYLISQLKF